MASPLIYLTPAEQMVFADLPADLRDGWEVKDESTEAYESAEALQMRAGFTPLRRHPAVKKLVEQVQAGADISKLDLPELSEEDIADFFFTIGARGVGALLGAALQQAADDEDMRLISNFSLARRHLLAANSSVLEK